MDFRMRASSESSSKLIDSSIYNSKLDIYVHVIGALCKLKNIIGLKSGLIDPVINNLKAAFENHDQSNKTIASVIKKQACQPNVPSELKARLLEYSEILTHWNKTHKNQSLDKRNKQLLSRYYESLLVAHILKNPPDNLMKSIYTVSKGIITIIERNIGIVPAHIFVNFLEYAKKLSYGFGELIDSHFSLHDIILLMLNNRSDQIASILTIHYCFMSVCYSDLKDYPIRKHALKVEDLWNPNRETYNNQQEIRKFMHEKLYGSDLFKDKGRSKAKFPPNYDYLSDFLENRNGYSSQMGIMLEGQPIPDICDSQFPVWGQDYLYTSLDKESNYVLATVNNDIPYVLGPSGMTTLILPAALLVGNLDSQLDMLYYVLAIVTYLVATANHNIHEVLIVAQYQLNLLNSKKGVYNISGENIGNYHHFISFFLEDVQFKEIRGTAWCQLLDFSDKCFLKKPIRKKQLQRRLRKNEIINKTTDYNFDKIKLNQIFENCLTAGVIDSFVPNLENCIKNLRTSQACYELELFVSKDYDALQSEGLKIYIGRTSYVYDGMQKLLKKDYFKHFNFKQTIALLKERRSLLERLELQKLVQREGKDSNFKADFSTPCFFRRIVKKSQPPTEVKDLSCTMN